MPRRHTWLVLVLLAGCMAASPPAVRAGPPAERAAALLDATAASAQTPEPGAAETCRDFVSAERELDGELTVHAPGPRGLPTFCLLYYPRDDVYRGVFLRVDSTAHFRAAKEDAVRQLMGIGLDVCLIGQWDYYGRSADADRTPSSDFVELPVECRPRVTPADAGAIERLDEVRVAVERARALVAEQMSWRQNRPLMVIVVTDVDVAVPLYRRFAPRFQTYAEQLARAGRSQHVGGSVFGHVIVLNLMREKTAASIDEALIHEFAHFAQQGIGGSSAYFPRWFMEGQAVYQEVRNSRSAVDVRHADYARRALADGTALRLADVSLAQDWNARDSSAEGVSANYSRAYVTMAYLVERHGFGATLALLQNNRNGSLENFSTLLTGLTQMDLDALDRAVNGWLMATRRFVATHEDSAMRLEATVLPGRFHLSGTVTFERRTRCGSAVLSAGTAYRVIARLMPDGEFSGRAELRNGGIVTLEGALMAMDEMRVTVRYQRPPAGCEVGPFTVAARIAS